MKKCYHCNLIFLPWKQEMACHRSSQSLHGSLKRHVLWVLVSENYCCIKWQIPFLFVCVCVCCQVLQSMATVPKVGFLFSRFEMASDIDGNGWLVGWWMVMSTFGESTVLLGTFPEAMVKCTKRWVIWTPLPVLTPLQAGPKLFLQTLERFQFNCSFTKWFQRCDGLFSHQIAGQRRNPIHTQKASKR